MHPDRAYNTGRRVCVSIKIQRGVKESLALADGAPEREAKFILALRTRLGRKIILGV
jgi:hypothetical protein